MSALCQVLFQALKLQSEIHRQDSGSHHEFAWGGLGDRQQTGKPRNRQMVVEGARLERDQVSWV